MRFVRYGARTHERPRQGAGPHRLRRAGHLVHTAASIAEAKRLVEAHDFDGAFIDVWLGDGTSAGARPYYGSVDATPLFLILLGTAFRWGAPRRAIEDLLPAASAAEVARSLGLAQA